jgi:hypothetical protein
LSSSISLRDLRYAKPKFLNEAGEKVRLSEFQGSVRQLAISHGVPLLPLAYHTQPGKGCAAAAYPQPHREGDCAQPKTGSWGTTTRRPIFGLRTSTPL